MAEEINEGTAYLLALKGSGKSPASSAAAPARETGTPAPTNSSAPASASNQPQSFAGGEKLRSPRYKCEGSVELREEGHDLRTWATFEDISMHGCYVEMAAPYPVGTALHLRLEANGFQVSAQGTVRVSCTGLGVGIAFAPVSEEDRGRLKELLRTISRPSVVMGPGTAASLGPGETREEVPLISDAASAIRALVEFFNSRQTMTRGEFLRALHKSQGSEPTR